jgi:PAS domain S-box-containing protein
MHLLLANKTTARMFGFNSVDEVMKIKNILDFIPPEERERTITKIKEIFDEYTVLWGNEYKVLKKSGEEIWIESAPAAVEYQGKKVGIIYLRDITERRKSEAQVTAYQKELRSLASQLVLAGERERRQIAREVHDRLTQTLAICRIKLEALAASLHSGTYVEPVREIHALIKQLVDESRSLTFEISSPLLYEFGLEAALERLTEDTQKQHGFLCPSKVLMKHHLLLMRSRFSFSGSEELLVNVCYMPVHNVAKPEKVRK